jgi:hypothetical protein
VHELRDDDNEQTPYVWAVPEDRGGKVLDAFGWCGIRRKVTEAMFVVWWLVFVGLLAAQYYHNYLGYSLKCWKKRPAGTPPALDAPELACDASKEMNKV